MGLYPMMGQDWYFLTAPAFTRIEVSLGESSRKLIIEAPKASPAHLYIAAASLNGKALNKAWIQHHEISDGARITFELSTTPTTWGRDTQPPSPITSGN